MNTKKLGHAIRHNNIYKVKELLRLGASPYTATDDKMPLAWCIHVGSPAIAKLLIEAGANTGDQAVNPLCEAISLGRIPIVKVLVEHSTDFSLCEGLMTAVKKPHVQMVEELIKLGADVNRANSQGEFPIICAVEMENLAMVKLLVQKGVDLNIASSSSHQTALEISLEKDDFRTAKFLIESGADLKLAGPAIQSKIQVNANFAQFMQNYQ